ncbi:MAG: HD-GYP domain-containing protein [Rectinemataceae bacterium]|jgi:HD-GYP domain-containing protein (c-di-GMP phosphodiesterase class II)
MKKRIALDQIKPGSRFSEDVFIDDKNLLVPAKTAVKQKDIDALKRWGVAFVVTEGSLVDDSASPGTDAPTSVAKPKPQGFAGSRELYLRYTELVDRLSQIFEKIHKGEPVESKAVDQISQGVLAMVRDERDSAISAILGSQNFGSDLARESVNIAILSTVIGITLKLPLHKLVYLVSGALLHDTGMLRIPDSIVKKKAVLSEDETQKVRAHPLISYRIITKELMYPDDVGLIGLQHHERWDSEGYPRKTASEEIDVLARIVSVADAFEAMVSEKPYRNSMIGYSAMKALLSDNSRRFDPDILKAFIKSIGIFPLGSTVLLNNSAIARVIETRSEAPLRPKLRIIVDEFGKHYENDEGDTIDLGSEKTLFIARALDPKELVGV